MTHPPDHSLWRGHGDEDDIDSIREQRDYWRGIAETVAPPHPVVAVHTDVLNEISGRAEAVEQERDALREFIRTIRGEGFARMTLGGKCGCAGCVVQHQKRIIGVVDELMRVSGL